MVEEENTPLTFSSLNSPSHDPHVTAVGWVKSLLSWSRSHLGTLLLGQVVSLCLCGTAVTSGLLQQQGAKIPTAQSFLNYVFLCLVYTTWLAYRREGRSLTECLKTWWWKYLLLALIDVEGNYLLVKAYNYTTVTSVQLLDCFSIPTVMILSCIILHVRYKLVHIGGATVCLLGLGGLVLADVLSGKNDGGAATNRLLGDFYCVLGATFYGISNVGQEFVVRHFDRIEFLGMIGFYGSIINGIQFLVLERDEVADLKYSYKTVLPVLGFAIFLFLLYSLMPVVIEMTSATAVNLGILSADFYTLLFGLFLFKYQFHYLYFISFGVIILGLCIFSARDTTAHNTPEIQPSETPAPQTTLPPETPAPQTTPPPDTPALQTTPPPDTPALQTTQPPETPVPQTTLPPERHSHQLLP